ncbi:MAG: DinB family protein [Chloroflexota bacterium]|nr:DinB family protein [Chloroflexota bacterium]
MEPNQLKAGLIDLLGRAQADQRELLAALSDDERAAIGTADHWSIKDVVLHIAFWKKRQLERLAAAARGEVPVEIEHFEQVNARVFEEWRERPWQAVIDESERIFDALEGQVREFDPAALADSNRYAWQEGRSLLTSLVGNGFSHPESHIAQCYIDRGDLPRATRMQEELTEQLGQYGDQLAPRGEALYNLACFYATSGQADKALALLPDALRLQPDVREWSKEDPDLVVLHGLPAYQALYES